MFEAKYYHFDNKEKKQLFRVKFARDYENVIIVAMASLNFAK